MDIERLMCRCSGGCVLEEIERLRAANLIRVDHLENGTEFFRLTGRGDDRLREFRNSAIA
jgi:hypothetical protein